MAAETTKTKRGRRPKSETAEAQAPKRQTRQRKPKDEHEFEGNSPMLADHPEETRATRMNVQFLGNNRSEAAAGQPEPKRAPRRSVFTRTQSGEIAKQKIKTRCMTVNVPEDILGLFELHAARRYDTLTSVVREAMLEYLRQHEVPQEIKYGQHNAQ